MAAEGAPGGGVEEGVGESSCLPRDAAGPTPAASGRSGGGAGGGARVICGEVFERLVAEGHEEAAGPDFRDQLEVHFAGLPHSYQLDINVDKAVDVLVHQKVLAEAKDPDRCPKWTSQSGADTSNKKQKTTSGASPADSNSPLVGSQTETVERRPIGRKQAKARSSLGGTQLIEMLDRFNALKGDEVEYKKAYYERLAKAREEEVEAKRTSLERIAKTHKEDIELRRRATETELAMKRMEWERHIMGVNFNGMTKRQRRYYELKQDEILRTYEQCDDE